MGDERDHEQRSWLTEALARRVRQPALEQAVFHRLEELQRGPLERLSELVGLVVEELRVAQRRLSEQAAEARSLERALAELAQRVGRLEAEAPAAAAAAHVVLLATPRGYRLVQADGPPPAAGALVAVDGVRYRVLRGGASPFPGDRRACVIALPH